MKKILFLFFVLVGRDIFAQPILVNSSPYAAVTTVAFDSTNNKIFYNFINGCPTWSIPCAYNYSLFSQHNLINKHDYTDNSVGQVLGSKYQVACPSYPINNYNSGFSRQALFDQNCIYTNFGYYFNKADSNFSNPTPIWTYSPASNPSFKEISTFEIKNDSLFLFQKDSTSGNNYYSVLVKSKLSGSNILYNSLLQSAPNSSLGAIQGHIKGSTIVSNTIIIAGVFTASISGVLVARNLIGLNITTGQLIVPPVSFTAGSAIYDLKKNNNKIYVAGKFTDVSGATRYNYAVMDLNLNLLNETVQFEYISDFPSNTWVDKIVFYDRYLIAKGNYGQIDGQFISLNNVYTVKVIDTGNNNALMTWTINLPGTPVISDYAFQIFKSKLYIKNRNGNGAPFYIYCFPPLSASSNIMFPGSTLPSPSPSIAICAPDNGNANVFVAPIRYATVYNWTYSGSNATIVPLGNGSSAKLITSTNSTNGLLSVTGTNDCGLSAPSSTLNVIIKQKPTFSLPVLLHTIICNPDSTQLMVSTTNTNASIWWRKAGTNTINPQPFYAKTAGNYYMIILDNSNGCKDSGVVNVNTFIAKPNAKIISHVYPGAFTPIDTVTCFQPTVNIVAASDTAGVIITWKRIANNSVFANPLAISAQNNLKIIVTRTANNCVDSSMIVLVGQNNVKPNIAISNSIQTINCSYYTASLNAAFSPSNCSSLWSGPLSYTSANPGITGNAGKYYFIVSDPGNGCSQLDSVNVVASNLLVLKSSNDTTVCKWSPVPLSSIRLGTLSGVTYSWNIGALTNTITVSTGTSLNYIVYANGPGGCFGSDTIRINIPADIQDSVIAYKNCDNNNQSGSIVMFAKGGIPPYKFSINNGISFSATNTFSNVPFDNYNLVIKDSIGCTRSTTLALNANSNLPVPKFLASTQNYKSDTIVLVDISIPKADSVQWILPGNATIIGGNMFSPVITISDTGYFLITMRTYYGSCIINANKLIRFSTQDSLVATYYNANGIKTFSLFPNPNTGQFTVVVEFYKRQNASIQAWDTSPFKHWQQNFYNIESITVPVNLTQLQNGNYILRVICEYDAKNKSFIINK